MLIGELGQNLGVDVAFAKQSLVLLQAEAAQPIPDANDRPPDRFGSIMIPAKLRVQDIDFRMTAVGRNVPLATGGCGG